MASQQPELTGTPPPRGAPPRRGGNTPPPMRPGATGAAVPAVVIHEADDDIAPTPPTVYVYSSEGFGKTSIAAHFPAPLILMAPMEHGYRELVSRNLVPRCANIAIESWAHLIAALTQLRGDWNPRHRTLVLDGISDYEQHCHRHVCDRDYNGDMSEKGFLSFQCGYATSLADWRQMLNMLAQIRDTHNVNVLLLGHAAQRTVRNARGADYDVVTSDLHPKTHSVTARWASDSLLGEFWVGVTDAKGPAQKGKVVTGSATRIIRCEQTGGVLCKSKGLPAEIELPTASTQREAAAAAAELLMSYLPVAR